MVLITGPLDWESSSWTPSIKRGHKVLSFYLQMYFGMKWKKKSHRIKKQTDVRFYLLILLDFILLVETEIHFHFFWNVIFAVMTIFFTRKDKFLGLVTPVLEITPCTDICKGCVLIWQVGDIVTRYSWNNNHKESLTPMSIWKFLSF